MIPPPAVTAGAGRVLGWDVPVDPDRDTARRWLLEELSRPEYSQGPSLLQRLLEWFFGLFEGGLPALTAPPWQIALIAVGVAALVVGIGWWVAGPVRLSRRAGRASAVVLLDDERTAADLRTAADDAAARGDWSTAVVERFRALVRSLEERVVLEPRPGRTAQEAADAAAERLPRLAGALHRAARLFDDVCYGTLPALSGDDDFLRTLDMQVTAERPELTGALVAGGTGSPPPGASPGSTP